MIAMQYSFVLPADYDMTIVDRRIREKGPLLDGFPHLRFKAYLSARKGADPGADNLYAPFYLWDDPAGIDRFLSSPGFVAVTRDFGWPSVRTWLVQDAGIGPDPASARFASCDITPVIPHANLASERETAITATRIATQQGALATLTGFDPTGWTRVHFRLWRNAPANRTATTRIFAVGHVALAARAS